MNYDFIHFFQNHLLSWYQLHGRHDLPWQRQSPYHVWISEIMLQQTQVTTVIPYYERFIARFPDIASLASASEDDVCQLWAGLGYYHRAKNIHKTAQILVKDHYGLIPNELSVLKTLPGIGPSTAAAITSQAYSKADAILDGNVKRVLARFFGIEGPINAKETTKILENLANACMPKHSCQSYTQAIMDMGATCCKPKNPACQNCPLSTHCQAYLLKKIESIPGKAIKKPIKNVSYHFLIDMNTKQELLLVKRPTKGIWPNLWCFPEATEIAHEKLLIEIQHRLTHQLMNIKFYLAESEVDHDENGVWVSENTWPKFGLPKAISAILPEIFLAVKSPSLVWRQLDLQPLHD